MKKIFTFAAMLFAAMSINAQETITCAQATEVMPAQDGAETEVAYTVVGYVTKVVSNPSPSRTDASVMQQRFWMDDVKGSAETVNCYWCDLPEEFKTEGLNVGDRISVTGKIINYQNKPEFKNAPITMIERANVNVETYDVTVCEALEEGASLNPGDVSTDIFRVHGRIRGTVDVNTYGQSTFEMACEESIFKAYLCKGAEGVEFGKGDSVVVVGKLYNYNGTIEISNGTVELVEKSGEEETIIAANVEFATIAAMDMPNGATSPDRYAVTGYVDSIQTAFSEQYQNISFFMCDDLSSPKFDFLAYRVKCTAEDAAKLVVGVKVTVTAALQHFYKEEDGHTTNLAETVAGGTLVFSGEQGIEDTKAENRSIKRIENGQLIIIREGVRFNALGVEVK